MWISEHTFDNPAFSDKLVQEVETVLGVKLPTSYINLMREQNGGYIDERLIHVEGYIPDDVSFHVGDGYVFISSIAGLNTDPDEHGSIAQTAYMIKEWSLPEGVVLLDGDGHTWIALDYRQATENPPVILLVSATRKHINIAKDFSDFIHKMIPSNEVYDEDGDLRNASRNWPKVLFIVLVIFAPLGAALGLSSSLGQLFVVLLVGIVCGLVIWRGTTWVASWIHDRRHGEKAE